MKKIYLPNYKDGSIVNLMASIEKSLGGKPLYKPLKGFKPDELKRFSNIILIVIDGLGYDYLMRNGKGSFLKKHLRKSITSTFPSTTASAITAFNTGVAPQQHAITGWFTWLKELGAVFTILPFVPRYNNHSGRTLEPKAIFDYSTFESRLKISTYKLYPKKIVKSDYTSSNSKGANLMPYTAQSSFFKAIVKLAKLDRKKKFIHAYWPGFDTECHHHSPKSKKALLHFKKLDRGLGLFIKKMQGTSSIIIITADHGQIDVPVKSRISLKDHPELAKTLALPLCGEPRAAYCYVHAPKAKQFEKYAKTKLKKCCWLFKSEDLISKNWFGLFKPNPKLLDRVGDYVLVMKKDYVIKDFLITEKEHFLLGNHGGVSRQEMLVPLIVVKP
ncbi:alkaline phosphatase family protein [Candidatus Woesearchaeota archaeon]|nr:alkaline phosphatase family protein [Candidatus Woesearchaeota archaeon]